MSLLKDKELMVGVVAVTPDRVESPQEVAGVIRTAMAYVPPERLLPCSNCGMTPIPYETALGKIKSIAAGAALVRRTL
jgi:5-methyltetrahydropteroyltriglutamate--homocysteine methyltransferase